MDCDGFRLSTRKNNKRFNLPTPKVDGEVALEEESETEIVEPKRFRVILLNDDYTTQEFVISILQSVFHKNFEESINLMLQIHHEGKGLCGVYPYDIAEMKVAQVRKAARANSFPLRAILEAV